MSACAIRGREKYNTREGGVSLSCVAPYSAWHVYYNICLFLCVFIVCSLLCLHLLFVYFICLPEINTVSVLLNLYFFRPVAVMIRCSLSTNVVWCKGNVGRSEAQNVVL